MQVPGILADGGEELLLQCPSCHLRIAAMGIQGRVMRNHGLTWGDLKHWGFLLLRYGRTLLDWTMAWIRTLQLIMELLASVVGRVDGAHTVPHRHTPTPSIDQGVQWAHSLLRHGRESAKWGCKVGWHPLTQNMSTMVHRWSNTWHQNWRSVAFHGN